MSKKIVIDKEVLDKLKSNAKKLIENTIGQTQKIHEARLSELETIEALATEIDTDQSIVDRAERYSHLINKNDEMREFFAYKAGATEQDLISKAREKELINIIGYHLSDSGFYMTKYVNGSVVWLNTEAKYGDKYEYTTEELFNQFTNR